MIIRHCRFIEYSRSFNLDNSQAEVKEEMKYDRF